MEREPLKIRLSTAFLLLIVTILICGLVGFYFYHTVTINHLKEKNNTENTITISPTATPTFVPTATPVATPTPESIPNEQSMDLPTEE